MPEAPSSAAASFPESPLAARLAGLGYRPRLLLAASTTFVMGLGSPPGGITPLVWLGFLPFFLALHRARLSALRGFWLGIASAMCVGLVGFPWIGEMLVNFTGVPWVVAILGLLGISFAMAMPFGLLVAGLSRWPEGLTGWRYWVAPAAGLAALQYWWPALFPYTFTLGFGEAAPWMQAAEIGGVHFVETGVILCGQLLARGALDADVRRRIGFALAGVAIPAASFGLGSLRMAQIEAELREAPSVRIGVVQPNTPVAFGRPHESMRRLWRESQRLEARGAQLIVWPEAGSYPYLVHRPLLRDSAIRGAQVMRHHSVPTLFGANSADPGARFGYNTLYALNEEGEVTGSYDKVNLVPFGEQIPLVDPELLNRLVPAVDQRLAGEAPLVLDVTAAPPAPGAEAPRLRLGPLICYEDILPDFTREVARLPGGVDAFVNVTIDAWYGDTAEPREHLALAQFRSVEHRVPLVRSVSTGISSVVDATGRVVASIPLRPVTRETVEHYPPESFAHTLRLARNTEARPTLFARLGWLYPFLCSAVTLALAAPAERARRRAGPDA